MKINLINYESSRHLQTIFDPDAPEAVQTSIESIHGRTCRYIAMMPLSG